MSDTMAITEAELEKLERDSLGHFKTAAHRSASIAAVDLALAAALISLRI
jgi:hypothetical protein